MSERFYLNCDLKPGEIAVLHGPEAHHLLHVCRFRAGDSLCLFNGNGNEYAALIRSLSKRKAEIEIVEEHTRHTELSYLLTIAAPVPKGDRATFLVEKLTEIGVSQYVPLRTARSVVHPSEGKLDKLRRTVIEASKQCGRNVLMKVEPTTAWEEICTNPDAKCAKIIAQRGGRRDMTVGSSKANAVVIAIGPEGGWTGDELELAKQHEWQAVDAGERTMRIETAAVFFAVHSIVERNSFHSQQTG